MASQQFYNDNEKQETTPAMLADTSSEVHATPDSTGSQTPPDNQRVVNLDQTLYDVCAILDAARLTLSDIAPYAQRQNAYEQAYYEERRIRADCALLYADLQAQHNKAIDDLHCMTKKCISLHREIEQSQNELQPQASSFQEWRQVHEEKDLPRICAGCGNSQSDWYPIERDIDKERLEARIRVLESEKAEMTREHQSALANAADHIRQVTQKNTDLERMREACQGQTRPSTAGQNTSDTTAAVRRSRKRKHSAKSKELV